MKTADNKDGTFPPSGRLVAPDPALCLLRLLSVGLCKPKLQRAGSGALR